MKDFEQVLALLAKYGKDLAFLGTIVAAILAVITALVNIVFNRLNKRDELRYNSLVNARVNELKRYTSIIGALILIMKRGVIMFSEGDGDLALFKKEFQEYQMEFYKSQVNIIFLMPEKDAELLNSYNYKMNILLDNVSQFVIEESKDPLDQTVKKLAEIENMINSKPSKDQLEDIKYMLQSTAKSTRLSRERSNALTKSVDEVLKLMQEIAPKFRSLIRKYNGL